MKHDVKPGVKDSTYHGRTTGNLRGNRWRASPVTVGGVAYPSRAAACRALEITPQLVHARLRLGKSLEEAFGLVEFNYPTKAKKVMVNGKEFQSLTAACKHHGASKPSVELPDE